MLVNSNFRFATTEWDRTILMTFFKSSQISKQQYFPTAFKPDIKENFLYFTPFLPDSVNNWIIGSWVVKGEFYISTLVPGKDRATFQPNVFEQTSLSLLQSDSGILSPWKKKTVHWKMHIFILTNLLWCLYHATLPHRGKMFTKWPVNLEVKLSARSGNIAKCIRACVLLCKEALKCRMACKFTRWHGQQDCWQESLNWANNIKSVLAIHCDFLMHFYPFDCHMHHAQNIKTQSVIPYINFNTGLENMVIHQDDIIWKWWFSIY